MAQGCGFQTALTQTLMHYRASQHATTGVSPAFLMLGREMQLPLDRLRVQGTATSAVGCSQAQVKASVMRRQHQMQQHFNHKHRVKQTALRVGDWVRAMRPQRNNKMASYWSQPLQVSRQLGPATFRLSDGSRWHAKRLKKVPNQREGDTQRGPHPLTDLARPSVPPPATQVEPYFQLPGPRPDPARGCAPGPAQVVPPAVLERPQPEVEEGRPARHRIRPTHLKDYVTEFYA